jgi:hypothetical protein
MQDPVWFVRRFKQEADLLGALGAATRVEHDDGRPRDDCDWGLLYLGYVLSGIVALRRFWAQYESSPVWRECGFDAPPGCSGRPPYSTLWWHFRELDGRF